MKRFLANLLTVVVSAAVALVAVELLLRLFFPDVLARDPILESGPLVYLPNQVARVKHIEWDTEVRINADGFRDDLALGDLPAGSIVSLGDSFAEGYLVDLEQSYAKKLQMLLRAAGHDVTVYNGAHTAANPPMYIATYDAKFEPVSENIDLVLLGFYLGNDFVDAQSPTALVPPVRNASYRAKRFLAQTSMLYGLADQAIKSRPALHQACIAIGACFPTVPAQTPDLYRPRRADPMIDYSARLIAAFGNRLAARGVRLLVVLIPTKEQVDATQWRKLRDADPTLSDGDRFYAGERLAARLADAAVDVLDLSPPFTAHYDAGGAPLYFNTDLHWNARGHDLAATLIAEKMRREAAQGAR